MSRRLVTDEMIEAFKEEWHLAERDHDDGNKVRRGLEAALSVSEPDSEIEWEKPKPSDRILLPEDESDPFVEPNTFPFNGVCHNDSDPGGPMSAYSLANSLHHLSLQLDELIRLTKGRS